MNVVILQSTKTHRNLQDMFAYSILCVT